MNDPRCATFSADISFLDALAAWLLEDATQDPLTLASSLILLPTRRACRSLREAFLRQSHGKPLLLPRISPLGDLPVMLCATAIPPAMPPIRRELMLAELIAKSQRMRMHVAYELATELCELIDEIAREGGDFEDLKQIVPESLAAHWQHTLEFLRIISFHWPRILQQEGMIDAGDHATQMMRALNASWQHSPPDYTIIAAGSTGSIPATAELLATIAHLPKGYVILPGLDKNMSDEAWKQLAPTHPQYALKSWLNHAGLEREQVTLLGSQSPITPAIETLFAPASLTAHWHSKTLANGFSHIKLCEAATQQDEARMIAVSLREVIETPGKTAALITPDRTLARMVSAQCKRFGIAIDDSAGVPLSVTASAAFMRLVLQLVENNADAHSLLACLRHPIAAAGVAHATCREYSRIIEKALLRGVRRETGLAPLIKAATQKGLEAGLIHWLEYIETVLKPLLQMRLRAEPVSLMEQLQAHVKAAEALAGSDEEPGVQLLWAKEAGEQLAECIENWLAEAGVIEALPPSDYSALFESMLARETFRPAYGTHPRLHILSPLEARLLSFDRVILGELNEGSWPAVGRADPWMSRPMRAQFGLPPEERHIGQSAQDVWMLLHAKEVLLTRARKIAGKPTVASRWWVRLTTLLSAKTPELFAQMQATSYYLNIIDHLDAPTPLPPLTRPEPKPPISARPTQFSATDIDRLRSEPYYIYAKRVLKLYKLEELDQEPDMADFGSIIHKALELFCSQYPTALPQHAYQELLHCGTLAFAPCIDRPAVKSLWWPRFEAIARHWLQEEEPLRNQAYTSHCELSSKWQFDVNNTTYNLRARADRIDVFDTGDARLIDYKTGKNITAKEVTELRNTQLPLTALALKHGQKTVAVNALQTMSYWFTKANENYRVDVEATDDLLAKAEALMRELIAYYQKPETPYAAQSNPKLALNYNDYEPLIRWKEWGQG